LLPFGWKKVKGLRPTIRRHLHSPPRLSVMSSFAAAHHRSIEELVELRAGDGDTCG